MWTIFEVCIPQLISQSYAWIKLRSYWKDSQLLRRRLRRRRLLGLTTVTTVPVVRRRTCADLINFTVLETVAMPEMVLIWVIVCATLEAGAVAAPELHLSGLATLTGNRLDFSTEYLAVPYVQPPVGPLRFKPPRALEHNNQVHKWDGTVLGPACPQNPEGPGPEPNQSEDCLQVIRCTVKPPSTPTVTRCLPPFQLNVWVPLATKPPSSGFSIHIWLHGGGWAYGVFDICCSNAHVVTCPPVPPPSFPLFRIWAQIQRVLFIGSGKRHCGHVVTLNYRLGPLGYVLVSHA